ncbi:DevA family ABC transporter ATP-binding protein [Cyanobium sp. NIES-981]|uniref:DevA family ABC transporter ATP-binding protein n=1 Tax=Cyanobium sp. NIES-981 TaxID=1851505 RepID=UPI0007DE1388|nr:DevA family ABC transporter ATP-binding protein [Cyanobium sp. NIES-981]SBO42343.1 Macrolide export ATP-binding/permease protein MacB [Cyanobium sp. NIES-981]
MGTASFPSTPSSASAAALDSAGPRSSCAAGPLVRIQGLSHWFGAGDMRRQVLQGINLQIAPGEVVLLTGPSGCGKTTLLTLVGALRQVQEGSVELFGQELHGAGRSVRQRLRRHIGMIFQGHNLLRCLSAEQNVQMGSDLIGGLGYRARRDQAREWLRAVGLGDHLHKLPHDLSGGQKQRVAIARALAAHPQLLLADEPTAALDRRSGREVVDLLKGLAREQGCGVLMVTHDPRILDVADRLVQMEDGRLSEASAASVAQVQEVG